MYACAKGRFTSSNYWQTNENYNLFHSLLITFQAFFIKVSHKFFNKNLLYLFFYLQLLKGYLELRFIS
jgi:hypothetical protein